MLRLAKAFILSLVAVYVFMNGPRFYSTLQFWLNDVVSTDGQASAATIIKPIELPVSDIDQKPLPDHATITIDRIGVSVPIVFGVPPVNEEIYKRLTDGMVHYSVTPKPGQSGASVILCHSSLYPWQVNKYGAPCALIGKLKPSDRITIRYEDGRVFNYYMRQSIVFNPLQGDTDPRLAEIEKGPRPLLFLVTCWPVNTTQSRFALQAELE